MIITDAIQKARSKFTVCFLLTAYLEAVKGFSEESPFPARVSTFPIGGRDDVAARFTDLSAIVEQGFGGTPCTGYAAINEAALVFGIALHRLDTLADAQQCENVVDMLRADADGVFGEAAT